MDIQTRKIEFIQEFLKVQNEELIYRLEKILKKENEYSQDENFEPFTVEEFNERIDKAMEDSKSGRLTKSSDLQEKMKKWG